MRLHNVQYIKLFIRHLLYNYLYFLCISINIHEHKKKFDFEICCYIHTFAFGRLHFEDKYMNLFVLKMPQLITLLVFFLINIFKYLIFIIYS